MKKILGFKSKNKFYVTYVIALFLLMTLFVPLSMTSVHAQSSTNWITSVSIQDITGNAPVANGQPLIAGHSYNVTLFINVPYTSPERFNVNLNDQVNLYGPQYWYVDTPNYAGFNQSSFSPGLKVISFNQYEGTLKMNVVFTIPSNITEIEASGLTLRKELTNFPLVTINIVGGGNVGALYVNVSDQVIQAYQSAYLSKSSLISSGKISPTYSTIVNGILAQAQVLAFDGLPGQATDLLNIINTTNFPPPPNNYLISYLMAGMVALVVIAAVSIVMMIRRGSKYSYIKSVVGEVENDLASLEVKAAQYDKALADKLKSEREKLGESY